MVDEPADLASQQAEFAQWVRQPDTAQTPDGIEPRRMKIYRELVYNNIEDFVARGFPVLKTLLDEQQWHLVIEAFVGTHRANTPYFLEIGEEFLAYLQQSACQFDFLPAFTLQLAHYEWIELVVDTAEAEPLAALSESPDLLDGIPVVNSAAWSLAYNYPVHQIRVDFQPTAPLDTPVYLVVYRNRDDRVAFLEVNAATARLLELLNAGKHSGREAIAQLGEELGQTQSAQLVDFGLRTLEKLLSVGILAGTR